LNFLWLLSFFQEKESDNILNELLCAFGLGIFFFISQLLRSLHQQAIYVG